MIDKPLPVPSVFDWLQEKGNVEDKEMYRTFNMGMGMMIVVDEKDAENALSILGSDSQIIGSVRNGQGVEHGALKTD